MMISATPRLTLALTRLTVLQCRPSLNVTVAWLSSGDPKVKRVRKRTTKWSKESASRRPGAAAEEVAKREEAKAQELALGLGAPADVVVDVLKSGSAGVEGAVAHANVFHMKFAPKKLKERIRFIRGLGAIEALRQLRLTFRQKDRLIAKAVENGIANAVHNHNMDPSRLYISKLFSLFLNV
jgi:hypothetical protein